MEIFVPSKLNLRETLEFCRTIRDLPQEGDVNLDFSQMIHPGAFAMLMISSVVQRVKYERPGLKFHPRHYAQHSYCGHMGFFRAMGIQFGREVGAARGGDTYLPVTIQEVVSMRTEAKETKRPVGEFVEETARSLAQILTRTTKGELFDTLSFALREIIRNTAEHSRSPAVEWCAQFFPSKDRVEIAVIDRGIGIFRSLSTNQALKIESERHAINLALLPGISRNVDPSGKPRGYGIWDNSGFGLFMTQRLCRFGGDFFLGSGQAGRFLVDDRSRWFDFGFEGTAVRLVLKPSTIGNLDKALKSFEIDAKRIAQAHNLKIPDASTASRRVRLDMYGV